MPTTTTVRAPKPQVAYPRPPLVHDHTTLFREPTYENGEPYTLEDDEDDESEA